MDFTAGQVILIVIWTMLMFFLVERFWALFDGFWYKYWKDRAGLAEKENRELRDQLNKYRQSSWMWRKKVENNQEIGRTRA